MTATREDYQSLIDTEEGEIFIVSLVEEVVQKSQDVLFEKHIESQVLPYAVQFAKSAVDEIIEWEFFRKDLGEIDPVVWTPDEEPAPVVIDSWAPGAIPIRKSSTSAIKPASVSSPPTIQSVSSSPSSVSIASGTSRTTPDRDRDRDTLDSEMKRPSVATSAHVKASALSLASSRKIGMRDSRMDMMTSATSVATSTTSTTARRRTGTGSGGRRSGRDNGQPPPLSAAQIAEMEIQEENKRTLSRIRALEKEGGKGAEWSYDHEGRIVVVKKAGAGKASTQGIKTKILPLEMQPAPITKPHPQPPGASTAAEISNTTTKRRGRILNAARSVNNKQKAKEANGSTQLLSKPQQTKAAPINPKAQKRVGNVNKSIGSLASLLGSSGPQYVEDVALEVPSLADTMKLSPGVTLHEGDTIKRGPSIPKGPYIHSHYTTTTAAHPPKPPTPPFTDPLTQVLARARPTIRRVGFSGVQPLPGIGSEGGEDGEGGVKPEGGVRQVVRAT